MCRSTVFKPSLGSRLRLDYSKSINTWRTVGPETETCYKLRQGRDFLKDNRQIECYLKLFSVIIPHNVHKHVRLSGELYFIGTALVCVLRKSIEIKYIYNWRFVIPVESGKGYIQKDGKQTHRRTTKLFCRKRKRKRFRFV